MSLRAHEQHCCGVQKAPLTADTIYEAFLSPWWDSVAPSQNFSLCQELGMYLRTAMEDLFFK